METSSYKPKFRCYKRIQICKNKFKKLNVYFVLQEFSPSLLLFSTAFLKYQILVYAGHARLKENRIESSWHIAVNALYMQFKMQQNKSSREMNFVSQVQIRHGKNQPHIIITMLVKNYAKVLQKSIDSQNKSDSSSCSYIRDNW